MKSAVLIGAALGVGLAAAASGTPPSLADCNGKALTCGTAGSISKADVNSDRDKTEVTTYYNCRSFGTPCGTGPAGTCKHHLKDGIDLVWYTGDGGSFKLCRASKDDVDCGC